jgi:hypothetical protein
VTLHPERLDQPLRWRKPARKVFVNSMSDLFHRTCPTSSSPACSRHGCRAAAHVPGADEAARPDAVAAQRVRSSVDIAYAFKCARSDLRPAQPAQNSRPWPLPNVWLGVSVENQQWADIRIPALLDTPAAVRFLSCEPLLGPSTDHIEILEQVARGSQLPGIAERTGITLDIVRGLAAQAGAPDLGEVRGNLRRLQAAEARAVPGA